MELFEAHNQWKNRPKDEAFHSIRELYDATREYSATSVEKLVPMSTLRTEAVDDDVVLVGRGNVPANLTYKAFGQFCQRIKAPASYLRTLPPTLAVQNLNHGLKKIDDSTTANLLFHKNGGVIVRAATSDSYVRIWHSEIALRALRLIEDHGWQQPTTFKRAGGANVAEAWGGAGEVVPSYFGQGAPELFIFLSKDNAVIEAPGGRMLQRGVIFSNSETGDASLQRLTFLFDFVCGNHIIWGAENVKKVKARHVGSIRERGLQQFEVGLTAYADGAASIDEAKIRKAASFIIEDTKEKLIDRLFRLDIASKVVLTGAYNAAEMQPAYGDPRSAWGIVNGLTEVSQKTDYIEQRAKIDEAASKVLQIAGAF